MSHLGVPKSEGAYNTNSYFRYSKIAYADHGFAHSFLCPPAGQRTSMRFLLVSQVGSRLPLPDPVDPMYGCIKRVIPHLEQQLDRFRLCMVCTGGGAQDNAWVDCHLQCSRSLSFGVPDLCQELSITLRDMAAEWRRQVSHHLNLIAVGRSQWWPEMAAAHLMH